MIEKLKLFANWTNDCSGKKDYDGRVLTVSTRYWPAGGSTLMFDPATPELGLHKFDDGSACSAKSSLLLWYKRKVDASDAEIEDYVILTEKDFEGSSFEAVASQVEQWAEEQYQNVVKWLLHNFKDAEFPYEPLFDN